MAGGEGTGGKGDVAAGPTSDTDHRMPGADATQCQPPAFHVHPVCFAAMLRARKRERMDAKDNKTAMSGKIVASLQLLPRLGFISSPAMFMTSSATAVGSSAPKHASKGAEEWSVLLESRQRTEVFDRVEVEDREKTTNSRGSDICRHGVRLSFDVTARAADRSLGGFQKVSKRG